MYHTSPNKIEDGMINQLGVAGSCLFFSDNVYVMTASDTVYVYEADFDCIRASQLHDEEIIEQIAAYFDVDAEIAEGLLDGSVSNWDYRSDSDSSWWLQGKRGECAVKMGYDGCEDEDEQGAVYIVPMLGRESELTLVTE
ncbi:hypothetical protein [Pseudoalteromonas ruthenica]|uniref:hypothetical protein n=1 Tax=Pseudoalteromonas ruthenica TaxID=151081 RepID=UPI00110A33AE|nr:hypothetical protein [Pseudoalteromonas ruthenica]TMP20639.1 hypothetical protein CWC06_19650 [Pseudoalteromonas ruthenica]